MRGATLEGADQSKLTGTPRRQVYGNQIHLLKKLADVVYYLIDIFQLGFGKSG